MKNLVFSPTEKKILDILGSKTMTIIEISDIYFTEGKTPLYPNNVIAGTIRRINGKCKYHKLNWFINGEGIGRGGKTVWRDKQIKGVKNG